MTRMLRAEFRKLAGTRMWCWMLVATVLTTGFAVAVTALFGPDGDPPLPGIDTEAGIRAVLGMSSLLVIFPALLGAAAMTQEYRHRTITPAFLIAPRRFPVVAAKVVVYVVVGAGFGLAAAAAAVLALGGVLLATGVEAGSGPDAIAGLLVRTVAAMAVYAVLGVGVGALLRNQFAALAVLGGYLYMGEMVLLLIPGVNQVYPYLPGGATSALTRFTVVGDAMRTQIGGVPEMLSAPLGALVLLGYGLAAAAVAVVLPMRRDVA